MSELKNKKAKKKSNNSLWFLLGILLCLILTNLDLLSPYKEEIKSFFNSNFSTAFFGAIGGSLTIILLDWFRKQKLILADINATIAILTSLSNTLLNIKKQFTYPLKVNYQISLNEYNTINIIRKYSDSKGPIKIIIPLNFHKYHCPKLDLVMPLDRIFTMVDKQSNVVMLITQAKQSIGDVINLCEHWNIMLDEFRKLPPEQKIPKYFGDRVTEDLVDTEFPDTVNNLCITVDDSLFFIKKSIDSLTKLAQASLPVWLKNKVVRSEIISKEHKALMPKDDHMEGWDE